MRVSKFLDKYSFAIITLLVIIAIAITGTALFTDASRDVENQIADLYEKERLVGEDFSNAKVLSGVTCYINEDDTVFIFTSNDCELTVKYSKDGEVLTKELKDTRIGKDFLLSVLVVIFMGICTFTTSGFLLALLYLVVTMVEERLIKHKQKKARGETAE